MRIPEELIEEIRERNSIVDVVGNYVTLEKKGPRYLGKCPFHNEKTPSFTVTPGKEMYYCFGCHKGGNVFTFLCDIEQITFKEAVKKLADRVGIEIPGTDETKEDREKRSVREQLYDINKETAKYYHNVLKSDAGARAREYFGKRQLTPQTINAFGLGAASMHKDGLYNHLRSLGYGNDILKKSGLFVFDESKGVRDLFVNRVMYPIINISHKIIGFGGRVMGDGLPKYINSPETEVFEKRKNLFGLYLARGANTGNIIICEGYMDVIALHQAGFNQAVASLGTALTPEQVNLIAKYSDNVLICYDSDGAGTKAALKAIDLFKAAGLTTKVIDMKPYKDPDEFIKALGKDAFQERINNAVNSIFFSIDTEKSSYDLDDPAEKTKFEQYVIMRMAAMGDVLERGNYITAAAKRYGIEESLIKSGVEELILSGRITVFDNDLPETRQPHKIENKVIQSQHMLLTYICDNPSIYNKVKDYLKVEDFTDELSQRVARHMFKTIEDNTFKPAALIDEFADSDESNAVAKIVNSEKIDITEETDNKDKAFNDALKNILRDNNKRLLNTTDDLSEIQRLMKEQNEIEQIHISLK